jgi:hypothetical protein
MNMQNCDAFNDLSNFCRYISNCQRNSYVLQTAKSQDLFYANVLCVISVQNHHAMHYRCDTSSAKKAMCNTTMQYCTDGRVTAWQSQLSKAHAEILEETSHIDVDALDTMGKLQMALMQSGNPYYQKHMLNE